ncbi:hypothetical protein C5469_22780 [Photorhabdus cinerea]|uniref:Uncharacterized protein n=1 Tax=Photorhabdus cinerea TaxID=471575 RepID=A0A7X5QIF0_9GAMM|nr:hypothetical protein [Photorhabdus cinerea]
MRVVRRYQEVPLSVYERRHPLTRKVLIDRITNEGTTATGEIKRPENIKGVMPKLLIKYGIYTPLRIAHFIGQMAAETGRFDSLLENGSEQYFDKNYGPGTVQGNKLGNNVIGDGTRFKGRGAIHLTGRENYSKYNDFRGGINASSFCIEPNNTLLATNAYYAFDAAGYYWSSKQKYIKVNGKPVESGKLSINYWADKGSGYNDAREVTGRINPGHMAFDTVRWPAFEHAWFILNDSIDSVANCISIDME